MQAQEKSCGIVVFREEAGVRLYLILRYTERHWDLPKGHVEKNETEEETARRETEEETGITDLKFLPGFHHTISYTFKRAGKNIPKDVVFFLAKTGEKEVKLSDEHIGFVWLPYQEALRRITYSNARSVLEYAEASLSRAPY
ncbi:MAG: NUDIX domain-containing protein [Candidatus Micrarchaeota archaeon]|nr:NUDIX domain-containing protein [Candidatus Micrarchaeota archaeon]